MEKQYSEEFFCTFVDNLQKLCRNFLDFEQVCEVSGYVCLMMDNSKQERYVLSEMVHNSGSVISESYCTKAFRTLPLMRNVPHRKKHYERDFSPEFDDEEYDSSMDSYTHSSMDSFSGEVPHGLAISNVQSLSTSQKSQTVATNLNNRNPTQMTNVKGPEKPGIPSDKNVLMKSESGAESDSKNVDKKRALSPGRQNVVVKQEICEEDEHAYEHSMKSDPVTTTSHKEQIYPHQRPPVQRSPPVHHGPPLKHGPVHHRPPVHHGPSIKHGRPMQHEPPTCHGPPIQHGPPVRHDPPIQHGPPVRHGPLTHHDPPVHHGRPIQRGPRMKHSPRMHHGPAPQQHIQHDPHQEMDEMEEGLIQIKQEPEDTDFIPNVEINSSIGDLNILKDEFLIAEPIGYLKPKEFPQRTGPKTKRTPRKVYVPLSTASKPEGNRAIQPRKFIKLEQSHPSDDGRVALHSPEQYYDEEHSGSESEDFMYDSNDSMNDSYSDMEDYRSYPPGQVMHGHPDMHVGRPHTFPSRQIDQDISHTPSRSQSFTPSHSEHDSSSLSVERHQPCTSVQKVESSNLPQDGQTAKAVGRAEKESANLPMEQDKDLPSDKHVVSSHSEDDKSNVIKTDKQSSDVVGHSEQGSDLPADAEMAIPLGPEKDSPNLSSENQDICASNKMDQGIVGGSKGEKDISKLPIEREDTYTSSHMQQGIAVRAVASSNQGEQDSTKKSVDKQDIHSTSNVEKSTGLKSTDVPEQSEQNNPNLTLEREDTYSSGYMEKGIGVRASITSGCSEKDSPHLSIEREDTYISSHMEKGIAMRVAVASCHDEDDDDGPSLAIEREDVYTSSHMARGIAMRTAVMSGHIQKEKPVLAVERQDTYTSNRMKQGIALRAAIAAGHCEQDLDSHDMYDPHYVEASDSHIFVSGQMEQSLASLPTDSVTTTASGHVVKAPSSLSNISLMEESGDEIIELDSDDIEEDEGLAAATASLSQHPFSQSQPNVPSTSSQGSIMAREPQRHMQNAVNLFTEYQRQQGYNEPMHLIPPQKLDLILAGFFENIRKTKTGEDFTPFSLKNIQNRLQKHLRENGYPYSITSDSAFSKSREILRLRIEELKCKVKNVPQKVDMVTDEDVEILFQKNQLGASSPDILFNTMWFINTMFLGIKSRIEHCNLRWGDIVLNIDHTGREFLRYAGPKQSVKNRAKPLFANTDDPDRCFVELYKIYEDRRPPELLMADAPFYGTVIKYPTGEPWFSPEPTPSTRFNGILQKMAKEAGLAPGKKFTNSSSYVK